MIVRMGMLQVYSVISVVILDHDAESTVELRHGDGGGGAHRVSSSRVAYLYFGVVFGLVLLFLIIRYHFRFSSYMPFLAWCKKHVLPLVCSFFN